jgi:hypothetical protein
MNARHTILDSNLARAHDKHTSFPRNLWRIAETKPAAKVTQGSNNSRQLYLAFDLAAITSYSIIVSIRINHRCRRSIFSGGRRRGACMCGFITMHRGQQRRETREDEDVRRGGGSGCATRPCPFPAAKSCLKPHSNYSI